MRRALLCVVAAGVVLVGAACGRQPFVALPFASPTPSAAGFGDGHLGDVTLTTPTAVNDCRPVSSASGTQVVTSGSALATGTLLLLMQVQDVFANVGDATPITSAASAGTVSIARVTSVNGTTLTVDPALSRTFVSGTARRAQLCTIPEYENLTIEAGGAAIATPWNGTRGGVVAIFARGRVLVEGTVDASSAGFRGGVRSTGTTSTTSVESLTTSPPLGGGKGESLDGVAWNTFGRGQVGNGAGGGNSHNAGGGGGGNGGAGGLGGYDQQLTGDDLNTAGFPGSQVALGDARVSFGGGGGGGQQDSGAASDGAAGGGFVLVASSSLAGAGSILANGATALDAGNGVTGSDGAGGGGAGGTVLLVAANAQFSGRLSARGGAGGNAVQPDGNNERGPGGGGGGGRVGLRMNSSPSADVSPGACGLNLYFSGPPGSTHGAQAGSSGTVSSSAIPSLPF